MIEQGLATVQTPYTEEEKIEMMKRALKEADEAIANA